MNEKRQRIQRGLIVLVVAAAMVAVVLGLLSAVPVSARTLPAGRGPVPYAPRRPLALTISQLDRQGMRVREIVRRLCGGPMLLELLTLGHFSRAGLVSSYLRLKQPSSD